MEEEHVVDDAKPDDLRRRTEEALECPASREATVTGSTSGANGDDKGKELRPKEHRQPESEVSDCLGTDATTRLNSPSISLHEGDGEKTARALHEDGTAYRVCNGRHRHMPVHCLSFKQRRPPCDCPVGEEATGKQGKKDSVLLRPRPVQRVVWTA